MKIEQRFIFDNDKTRITDSQIDIILDGDSDIVKEIFKLIEDRLFERGYDEW